MELRFKNLAEGSKAREYTLPLNTKEDFEKVIERFPQLGQSLYMYNDVKQAAEDMAAYLSSHYVDAWVVD